MKCKSFFGHYVCKVKNDPTIYSIPTANPITMDVVTSSSCAICKTMVNGFVNNVVKPIKNIVKVNLIDIDHTTRNIANYDLVLPSFHLGKVNLGSNPNAQDVLRAMQKNLMK